MFSRDRWWRRVSGEPYRENVSPAFEDQLQATLEPYARASRPERFATTTSRLSGAGSPSRRGRSRSGAYVKPTPPPTPPPPLSVQPISIVDAHTSSPPPVVEGQSHVLSTAHAPGGRVGRRSGDRPSPQTIGKIERLASGTEVSYIMLLLANSDIIERHPKRFVIKFYKSWWRLGASSLIQEDAATLLDRSLKQIEAERQVLLRYCEGRKTEEELTAADEVFLRTQTELIMDATSDALRQLNVIRDTITRNEKKRAEQVRKNLDILKSLANVAAQVLPELHLHAL